MAISCHYKTLAKSVKLIKLKLIIALIKSKNKQKEVIKEKMAQFPCPAEALLNFAKAQMFDEDQMSITDKILIRLWIGTAIYIFTIIALYDKMYQRYQQRKKRARK